MARPAAWHGEAFNQVPESENRIHADDVARAYGFRGALVPGVTVSAYLLHPALVAWGEDWLARGFAHCVVHSPVYDGEPFRVDVKATDDANFTAQLFDREDVRCASAEVGLPDVAPPPPRLRGDPRLDRSVERPRASRAVMETLRERGLYSLRARWDEAAEITSYLRDPRQMAPACAERGFASPAFVLGLTNWVLAGNVRMSPWLHLETESQNHAPIARGSELIIEAAIADLFEKKGHEFVDVEVGIFHLESKAAAASVRLRAIHRLRDP